MSDNGYSHHHSLGIIVSCFDENKENMLNNIVILQRAKPRVLEQQHIHDNEAELEKRISEASETCNRAKVFAPLV